MKFFNHELNAVNDFILNELTLSGKQNRMRMKFLKILAPKLVEFGEYRLELLKEHARKDEQGNPILIEKDGVRVFDVKDMAEFQQAFSELNNEFIIIEENEENREILLSVKEALNNCDADLKGQKASLHEYLCEKFDDIYKPNEITIL